MRQITSSPRHRKPPLAVLVAAFVAGAPANLCPSLMRVLAKATLLSSILFSITYLQADTLYWDGIDGNWSSTANWSTSSNATTPNPAAVPGATNDVVFNITISNNVNQEVSLNSANRSAASILINNSGTTLFRRASGDSTSGNYLQVGAGGFTLSAASGAVTFGTVSTSGQVTGLRAATGGTSLGITNNSSSLLTFNHATSSRAGAGTNATITFAGSGSGGINQAGPLTAIDGTLAVSVNMTGTGVVTFGGANTSTGATTVSAGVLRVNGSTTSATTVQSGATLGGNGSVDSVVVESGGTIAPGNSPGTLTITNGLTWAGGGNYDWQIFNVSGTAGESDTWDLINVTGGTWDITGLSSTNKFNINLWSLSGLPDTTGVATGFDTSANYSWKILASAGVSGTFNTNLFNINTSPVNGTGGFVGATGLFSLQLDVNNDLFLNYTGAGEPIPEPGTWAAAGLLALAAGYTRWRRRLLKSS
jgi:autotransporter-associated beta strand protein